MPNVSLTPELGAFAAACVASGRYANVSEVHRAALRLLRDAVVSAAHRIGANPQLGAPRPRLADPRFRFLILPGFP